MRSRIIFNDKVAPWVRCRKLKNSIGGHAVCLIIEFWRGESRPGNARFIWINTFFPEDQTLRLVGIHDLARIWWTATHIITNTFLTSITPSCLLCLSQTSDLQLFLICRNTHTSYPAIPCSPHLTQTFSRNGVFTISLRKFYRPRDYVIAIWLHPFAKIPTASHISRSGLRIPISRDRHILAGHRIPNSSWCWSWSSKVAPSKRGNES